MNVSPISTHLGETLVVFSSKEALFNLIAECLSRHVIIYSQETIHTRHTVITFTAMTMPNTSSCEPSPDDNTQLHLLVIPFYLQ